MDQRLNDHSDSPARQNRRQVMRLGAGAAGLALLDPAGSFAQPTEVAARLETRLFNFKEDVPLDQAAALVAALKAAARTAEEQGVMAGRNFIPNPFPARFEWVYMAQFKAGAPIDAPYREAWADVAAHCRNDVVCDLKTALPPHYGDAPGVKVRHTVMFNFKPDASAEAQARNVNAIRTMGKLPMVKHYLVQESADYTGGPNQMQWQVVGDFDSVADYRAYAEAPVHLAIREDFTAHTSRVAFLDVQV